MTKFEKIDMGETGKFSPIFLDFLSQKENLSAFYHHFPSLDQFEQQIKEKTFSQEKRMVLVQALEGQYACTELSGSMKRNLELLKQENTFTITTGHQLNLFTGPLYFIYKIVTAINACKQLKEKYPNCNFVPIYWAATEDHDFEEINHFNLFNKKYEWNTEQKGAVGRFKLEGIKEALLDELPENFEVFEKAYTESDTLTDAVRAYILELFSEEGLLMIDGDDALLKKEFSPIITDELVNNRSHSIVTASSEQIEGLGYKAQVYPREINLFYLEGDIRQRIVKEGDKYQVLNTKIIFSQDEILALVESNPERFSPNVILRPLYEEVILPNLAYIGGPGEFAYWLQLKGVFEQYQVPFPILLPRNFALIVNGTTQKKLEKTGLSVAELFVPAEQLKQKVLELSGHEEVSLEEERKTLEEAFSLIKKQAENIDKGLQGYIGAEESKMLKGVTNIEKRLKKAQELKHETKLKQLSGVLGKLFPNGGLQERSENFLNFYQNNPNFIQQLIKGFDPFDLRFNLILEHAESPITSPLSEQTKIAQG